MSKSKREIPPFDGSVTEGLERCLSDLTDTELVDLLIHPGALAKHLFKEGYLKGCDQISPDSQEAQEAVDVDQKARLRAWLALRDLTTQQRMKLRQEAFSLGLSPEDMSEWEEGLDYEFKSI
ncbi:MAG: hypothetical protein GC164_15455 [Phycisphaera sp.]|nr:hypothetical protein [Phycisphaera sp.]